MILDEILREVDKMQAKYIMVIHPDQFQVENELRNQLMQNYHLNLDRYDFDLPQRFLTNYCASRRIPCLDLLPRFRESGSAGGLYLLRDTQYNNQGNTLAANIIYNFLMDKKLLVTRKYKATSK